MDEPFKEDEFTASVSRSNIPGSETAVSLSRLFKCAKEALGNDELADDEAAAVVSAIVAADDYRVHLETLPELQDLLYDQVFSGVVCADRDTPPTVVRSHKCAQCGKYSTTKANLQQHIRCVHRGERPYACTPQWF